MTKSSSLLILLVSSCLLAHIAEAASITGSTTLSVDSATGTVTATCETDVSIPARAYYQASVQCEVYDGAGNWKAGDSEADVNHLGHATVIVSFQGVPGTAYRAQGFHSATALVQDQEPSSEPPYTVGLYYVDYYNFGYYGANPVFGDYDGQLIQDPYQYYVWQGPGPLKPNKSPKIFAGNTRDARVYPIDTTLLIEHASEDFPTLCNTAFSQVIGSTYTKANFFQSLQNTIFYQYPLGTPNIPRDGYGVNLPDADTLTAEAGRPIRLFPNFYGPPDHYTTQGFRESVVIHEGIHHYTGWGDSTVFANFYNSGLRNPNGITGDIASWIAAGCPNPWNY